MTDQDMARSSIPAERREFNGRDSDPLNLAPHSVEAEEAVLGSILMNPEAMHEVRSFLTSEDFFILRHGWIYEALERLHERGDALDTRTLAEELRAQGRLDEVGGEAYLRYLPTTVPTALHAEVYGHIVERAAIRRRLLGAAGDIAQLAHDQERDINQVIDQSEAALFTVTERRLRQELLPMRIAISEYFDRIERLRESEEEALGVPTGFYDLDRLLGGLQKSDLIVVAGRPGMGKTSFVLTLALNAARQGGARIAIFSMEMSNEQLVQRLIASETGISSQDLRLGKVGDSEWQRFVNAVDTMSGLKIFFDDSPAVSTMQLRTKCRRLYREHGLDLIIVDYLQLMSSGTSMGRDINRVQEITYISRALKELARELNVPLVSAAQLSRAVEQRQDKRPQLSDLRESGCLAGDTLVALADSGHHVPIRDLVGKAGVAVWALNETTMKLERAVVSHAFSTGVKPVYRMTTRLGRSVRATANHKFLTIGGWKRLDELAAGEHIALPRVLPGPYEQTMSDAELALLAHLIGDGCTLPRHVIQYTTRERDLAEMVVDFATSVFGDEIRPRIKRERSWYQVYLPTTRQHTQGVGNPISDWLSGLGVFGLRSHEKRVPDDVFQQPAEAIALFLRHLWATDGCIKLTRAGKRYIPRIFFGSSSEGLAQDVGTLLLRLGITARLKRVPQKGKGRDQHHVIVTGKEDTERFIERVAAVGSYKQRDLALIAQYTEDKAFNTNRDVVPSHIWQMYAVPARQANGITARQMQAKLGNAYCGTGLYRQNVSRGRAARLGQAVKSPEIIRLAESDVYWDQIVSIEPDGEEEVFDLTVLTHHNFVSDNIIVHNSIEQDADVVIFLYRDEVYNEATEHPGEADVIVAKHRNGPTGTVTLLFRKEQTKFVNLRKQRVDLNDIQAL